MGKTSEEIGFGEARLSDLCRRADAGAVAVSPYLTPAEQIKAKRTLSSSGYADRAWFWGGYPDAERACLFLLPEYLLDLLGDAPANLPPEAVAPMLGEDVPLAVTPLRLTGSGFRNLGHRDYLGSLLSLGLERDAVGDIAVQNDREAVLFCTAPIAAFLSESLERVANDPVKVLPYTVDETFTDGRHYRPISDTVASCRLDCVVAALTNLSREDAQNAIRSGLVDYNFETSERTDLPVEAPATLSVRGFGRYLLRAFDGETRKGRIRLRADQLI